MTYTCCLCHGLRLEPAPHIAAAETRRMFANCIMRSGTLPTLVRSDRGPELKNALMAECVALVGVGHRFLAPLGARWDRAWVSPSTGRHRRLWACLSKTSCSVFGMEQANLLTSWGSSSTIRQGPTVTLPELLIAGGPWLRLLTKSYSRSPLTNLSP